MIKMKFSLEMSVSLSLTVEFYYSVTFEYIFIEFNWEKIFFRFVSFRLLLFYRSCYILTSSDGERINILLCHRIYGNWTISVVPISMSISILSQRIEPVKLMEKNENMQKNRFFGDAFQQLSLNKQQNWVKIVE